MLEELTLKQKKKSEDLSNRFDNWLYKDRGRQTKGIKYFLMLEPMVSLVVTFGGLWLLWSGVFWMKYIIMISGIMMHLSLVAIILLLLKDLLFHKSYFAK